MEFLIAVIIVLLILYLGIAHGASTLYDEYNNVKPDTNISNNDIINKNEQDMEESKYLNIKAMDLVVHILNFHGIYGSSLVGNIESKFLIKFTKKLLNGYLYLITIKYYKKTGKYLLEEDFMAVHAGVEISGLYEKYLEYLTWMDKTKICVDLAPKSHMREIIEEANKNINLIAKSLGFGIQCNEQRFRAIIMSSSYDAGDAPYIFDGSFLTNGKVQVDVLDDIINNVTFRYTALLNLSNMYIVEKIKDNYYDNAWLLTMRERTGENSWFHFKSYGYTIPKELIIKCTERRR